MKNIALHRILVLLLGTCFAFPVARSQESIESIANRMEKHFSSCPSELIYLQTSKGIYETGEDLWFKAYQLNSQTFGLSDKSKTLYLQMISSKDSVVWQEKYPVENGIVSGHVYIDEKLLEGDYFLEGYTKSSFYKNDTVSITPKCKIKIVKNIARWRVIENPKDTAFRFEVFPEGGNLVSGLPSKLAFKATDGKGHPVFVEGTIYQDDKSLLKIKSVHDGMGAVLFTPLANKRYRIELNNGNSYRLPEIHPQGIVLRLSGQDRKQLEFVVSQSEGIPDDRVYLLGQMRGMVCCVAKGLLRDSLRISIPLDNFLYQGIAEFTLFDSSMRPIAERLVYVHSEKKLHITVEPDKKSFFTREKGTIRIKVTDEKDRPVKANLGVSVFDGAYDDPANPMNILSYYYLSSQIRGKIYNPTYYFDERNNGRTEGMDLLLLTQGWRRYVWSLNSRTYTGEIFITDEITGKQTIGTKKQNFKNQKSEQLIQVSGPQGNSLFIWADSIGGFIVDRDRMKELQGGYVYLKPMLSKEFKPELKIDDLFSVINIVRSKRKSICSMIDLPQDRNEKAYTLPIASRDSTILLDEVTVIGKGRKPFRDKFMGRLDSLAQKYLGPWVCSHGWLENYKEGYTHHHDPRYCPSPTDDGEPRTLPVIGQRYHIQKNEYFQCNSKGGWCFKPVDSQWIIYKGIIYSEEELLRMNNLWRTKGYYASREFYQPDEVEIQSSIPDARNTLLWAPSVITDEKGEAKVSFYCSDINTGFVGTVEGVDGLGLLGTTRCEFRVIRK